MNFAKRASELQKDIERHRHYLHRHAELSFKEFETTQYIVGELEKLGLDVQRFEDYTGCIARIHGKYPGPTVMLRADIDALPIEEKSGVDFESERRGVMHACGHDCHASMLLGAAALLNEAKDSLHGTVVLLFQAAEEAFIGSYYYWDNGHLSGIDAAMGMHVWPSVESGKFCIKDGAVMASCDNFKITIHGSAAHGSQPNKGCDAIVAASAVILNLQTIVSRIRDPIDTLVLSIGTIRAGTRFNIITDKAVMEGTVRAYNPATRAIIEENLKNIAQSTAKAMGCSAEIEYTYIDDPVQNLDTELNNVARAAAVKLYGDDALRDTPPSCGGEDFGYLMQRIPSSLYVFLGCRDEESGCIYSTHSEKFKINESILQAGAAFYAQFAADYLENAEKAGEKE